MKQAFAFAFWLIIFLLVFYAMFFFGVGIPLDEKDLIGLSQVQVRNKYGTPAHVRKNERGNDEWTYNQHALIFDASTDIEFENGVVTFVFGHSAIK